MATEKSDFWYFSADCGFEKQAFNLPLKTREILSHLQLFGPGDAADRMTIEMIRVDSLLNGTGLFCEDSEALPKPLLRSVLAGRRKSVFGFACLVRAAMNLSARRVPKLAVRRILLSFPAEPFSSIDKVFSLGHLHVWPHCVFNRRLADWRNAMTRLTLLSELRQWLPQRTQDELFPCLFSLGACNSVLWELEYVARRPDSPADPRQLLDLIQQFNADRAALKSEINGHLACVDADEQKLY